MSVTFGHAAPPRTVAPKFGALFLSVANPALNKKALDSPYKEFEFRKLETDLAQVPKTENFIVRCSLDDNPNNYRINIFSFPIKHLEMKEGIGEVARTYSQSVLNSWDKHVIVPAAELLTEKTKKSLTEVLTKMVTFKYTDNRDIDLTKA